MLTTIFGTAKVFAENNRIITAKSEREFIIIYAKVSNRSINKESNYTCLILFLANKDSTLRCWQAFNSQIAIIWI